MTWSAVGLGRFVTYPFSPARAVVLSIRAWLSSCVPPLIWTNRFWRGREFGSLEQMQDAAVTWCRDVAGQRSHRGLDGATPAYP